MGRTSGEKQGRHCPVETTLALIGGKYKALVLWTLLMSTMRFSELHRAVPNATPKMLTQHLRELEEDGLVVRKVYPVVPPRVEYSLTEFGRSLRPVLEAMYAWGGVYLQSKGLQVNCSMQPLESFDGGGEGRAAAQGAGCGCLCRDKRSRGDCA